MDLKAAVRAAAHDAPETAIDGLDAVRTQLVEIGVMKNELRVAHMIGQCAHESARFTRVAESLFFTTPARILAVWPSRFGGLADAKKYIRNPEKLANKVYASRMGNGEPSSGDGYRYRGRGYLQLTGRSNYRTFGRRLGIDLIGEPELAEQPETAWLIAASYLATRSRTFDGTRRTALEWADQNNVEAVTKIVNGGTHGLSDRQNRTARALAALGGLVLRPTLAKGDEGDDVILLQRALAARGFSPGAMDGDFGPRTHGRVVAFQQAMGLNADGIVGRATWDALDPIPS